MSGVNVNNNGINVYNNSINVDNNREIERERETERESNIIKLNYTKLDLLFNYLIMKDDFFEGLVEADRIAIIEILKKLKIYTTTTEYCTKEKLQELKIQYWAIKELYACPYKVYLDSLIDKDFTYVFLKAKVYKSYDTEEKLQDFMGYFIKSLMEEMRRNGN